MAIPALAHGPQYWGSGSTSSSLAGSPASTPAAGNKLFLGFSAGSPPTGVTITDSGTTPGAWTLVGNLVLATTQLWVWSKVSSGDETTITVSWGGGTTYSSANFMEWSSAGATETAVTGSTASASTPVAFGPISAPSNANAVPIVFMGFRKGGTLGSWTVSSGWTAGLGAQTNDSCLSAYQTTPPNAAVSGSMAYTGSGPTGAAVAWLGFFLDPPGSSSNPAAVSSGFGAFACGAAVSATLATAIAAGIGPNATAATASAANATATASALGAASTAAQVSSLQAINAGTSFGALAASLTAAQHQALAAAADFGPLSSSLTVSAISGIDTAAIDSSLGALSSSLTVTAHAGINSASVVATLPGFGTVIQTGATQAMQASALLALETSVSLSAQTTGQIHSTLGPLATSITAKPPPAGYVADGNYYVALAARPFYASLAARPFYILSNPNMTPIFNTLDPRETLVLTFDGTADLASGETLTAIDNVAITVQSGAPTSTLPTLTGQVVNGSPVTLTVNGKTITIATGCCVQAVGSGGVTGTQYLIAITCATSNPDKVLTLKGILPVSAN